MGWTVDGLLTQATSSVPGRVDGRESELKVLVCLLLLRFAGGVLVCLGLTGGQGLRHSIRDAPIARSDGPLLREGEDSV